LEISGPKQEHLRVIDVPEIFKSITEGVTTKADIQLVRNMVKGYMDNPRAVNLDTCGVKYGISLRMVSPNREVVIFMC
jgi:hypothetical protein